MVGQATPCLEEVRVVADTRGGGRAGPSHSLPRRGSVHGAFSRANPRALSCGRRRATARLSVTCMSCDSRWLSNGNFPGSFSRGCDHARGKGVLRALQAASEGGSSDSAPVPLGGLESQGEAPEDEDEDASPEARAAELLARLARATCEGEARAAADGVVALIPSDARKPLLQALFAAGGDRDSVLFDMADLNDDGVLDSGEFAQFLEATRAANADDAAVRPLTQGEVVQLFVRAAIGNIGFGITDNAVMITAGSSIEATIGHSLGLSTLLSAGLGNAFSDVIGTVCKEYIESASSAFMPPLRVSSYQLATRQARRAEMAGSCTGITIGCMLGLTPLLFLHSGEEGADPWTGRHAGGAPGSADLPAEPRAATMVKVGPTAEAGKGEDSWHVGRGTEYGGRSTWRHEEMSEGHMYRSRRPREGDPGLFFLRGGEDILLKEEASAPHPMHIVEKQSALTLEMQPSAGNVTHDRCTSGIGNVEERRPQLEECTTSGTAAVGVPQPCQIVARSPERQLTMAFMVVGVFMAMRRIWQVVQRHRTNS